MTYQDLIWDHFKFNADQRLKAFNFFLLLSIFADGGIITALERRLGSVLLIIIGLFLILLSLLFWLADARSKDLLSLSIEALREIEKSYPKKCRIFEIDSKKRNWFVRFTTAISALLAAQLLFGLGVIVFGLCGVWH